MRAQFHLPLLTYPDPSSFALIQNAIDFARHQEARLHVSVFKVKIPKVSPPFPPIVDVDKMSAEAERSSRDCAATFAIALRRLFATPVLPSRLSMRNHRELR